MFSLKIRGQGENLKLHFFRCVILADIKDGYKLWVVLKKCFCVINYVITTESEVSSFFLYLIKDN